MKHKEYFDSVAYKWDNMVVHDQKKLKMFFKIIDLKAGNKILDVGTGTGVLIPYIANAVGNTGEIDAVDLSSKMLEIAKSKFNFTNVRYIQADVNNLNMNEQYDAIICYSVFPHFDNQEKTVIHLAKGLKNHGKLIICHSQSRKTINNLHKNASEEVKKDRLPSMKEIIGMMKKAGLSVIKTIDNQEVFFIMGINKNPKK